MALDTILALCYIVNMTQDYIILGIILVIFAIGAILTFRCTRQMVVAIGFYMMLTMLVCFIVFASVAFDGYRLPM